jgi:transposase
VLTCPHWNTSTEDVTHQTRGKHAVRKLKRAQILLAADAGIGDEAIAGSISVGGSTVYRTKRRFVEGNLDLALSEEARPGAARKLSGKETALLVATVCSSPPAGSKRWTLDLLAGQMVQLTEHEGLSRETVRRRLAEDDLKAWLRKMWCIPEVNGTYVARMEDVLDLYAEEPDPRRPVVCFDESPTQLIDEVREPIPAAPGQPERYDCEYKRNGTANLFVFLDAHKSWRHVKVTDQRTARDFAECMRDLADIHYPDADRIRVVRQCCTDPGCGWRPEPGQRRVVPFVVGKPAVPFKHHAARRHHIPKPRYRVTNWREYDAALRRRGSLTVWFTDDAIAAWLAEPRTTPGGQPYYSALAITTALTVRGLPSGITANRRAHWLRHRAAGPWPHRAGSFDDVPPEQDVGSASTSPVRNRSAQSPRGQHRP